MSGNNQQQPENYYDPASQGEYPSGSQYGYPPQYMYQQQQQYQYQQQMPQDQYYDHQNDQEDYDEDDYNLDEIDKELSGASMDDRIAELVGEEEASPGKYGSMPPGSTPQQNGKLSAVAKEFWFPESRNCNCCKGFKHGCACCVGSVTSCSQGDCTKDAVNLPTPPPQVAVSNGTKEIKPSISIPSNASGELCRFESAPGGCRFGAGCRFLHASSPTAGATGAITPKSPSNEIPCSFFQRGACSKGDSCRFSHKI